MTRPLFFIKAIQSGLEKWIGMISVLPVMYMCAYMLS